MWGKKRRRIHINTLIGKDTVVEGNVRCEQGLHLDGGVRGHVSADEDSSGMLQISDKGWIEGDVRVPVVIVNGTVTGNIYAHTVELMSQAKIQGEVRYQKIEVDVGAVVTGQLIHAKEQEGLPAGDALED